MRRLKPLKVAPFEFLKIPPQVARTRLPLKVWNIILKTLVNVSNKSFLKIWFVDKQFILLEILDKQFIILIK